MDQAPKLIYYAIMSYQLHARMKAKEEKPLELIVSCESQVLSIHDKKNPPHQSIWNGLGCQQFLNILAS